MKQILYMALCLTGFIHSQAQTTIRGTVYDVTNKNPLAGATISFAGKGGTATDRDGMFSIECGRTNRITVSFLGYESFHQNIRNCDEVLRIGLVPVSRSLNEVEITATSTQNKSILHQPASITKLSPVELKRNTGLFLDDAINTNAPGVSMERRTVSAGQQFNIRGYGNGTRGTNGVNSNFDGQGYKVYLNGIPVTDAEGITLMDDIDFGSIGDVEITKGPSGTLNGLAIAGVVNLKTIKPEKGRTSIGQDVLIGSYGLQRFTTHFRVGGKRSSLLLNYGHQESDGFMTHTASHKDFINIAGDFQPNEKQTVNTYFGYSNSYDQRGGELTIAQYNAQNYSGNPVYIKNNAHSEIIGFRFGAGHTYRFNNHLANTTTVFASGISNNSSSAAGWTDKDPINFGLRSTLDTRFALSENFGLSGITGVETQSQRAQTIGYAMVPDSTNLAGYNRIGATRNNQFTVTANTSVFTEWTLSMPHALSLTAGIGWSNMKIELNDRFYLATAPRAPSKFSKTYDGMLSPHFALNKVFSELISVYASYSKGYKAPVSSYFFIPFVSGAPGTGSLNNGLEPEIGNQYEIGTKGALLHNDLTYELALFDAVFSRKMTTVAVPLNSTTTAYSYVVNGGRQNNKGIELLVKYTAYESGKGFFRSVRPFANVAYSKFRDEDFKFQALNAARTDVVVMDYSGKAVAGVPPVTFNAGIDLFTNPGLYANASYSYRDAMPITSDGSNRTKSFSLLNSRLGYRRSFGRHFDMDVFAGGTNLTGSHYYFMVFVNQLPDAYLPAPRHTVYFGGLNIKYNF
jgi:iron complex outermembrane receptor protein